MHRAHFSTERLGIAREFVCGERLDPRFAKRATSSLRRHDLIAILYEILAEFHDTLFVVDAYISSFICFHTLDRLKK